MAQVIVNPEEMRRFARALDKLVEEMRGKKYSTGLTFKNLRDSWKDQKYNEFEKTFNEASKNIDQFLKSADAYAKFLDKKAALADRYLGR